MSAILVDSNILIYPHDPRDGTKQKIALDILDRLIERNFAVLSVQCVTEFYRGVCWRLPQRLDPGIAIAQVERLILACRILSLTPQVVLEGCHGTIAHQLSYWDALIWASAKHNQVPHILTEDAEHGRVLEGVHFLDPFHPAFEMAMLEV